MEDGFLTLSSQKTLDWRTLASAPLLLYPLWGERRQETGQAVYSEYLSHVGLLTLVEYL